MNIQDIQVKDLQNKINMLSEYIAINGWSKIDSVMSASGIIINVIKTLPSPLNEQLAKDVAKLILDSVNIEADFEEGE